MSDGPDQIDALAGAVGKSGPLKVWSVIVTILGDIAQSDPKAELAGPVLTEVMARLGVQAEAVRVAVHRLRQDDWVESRKQGRTSYLRLSVKALAETRAVSDRVFGPAPRLLDGWTWMIGPPSGAEVPGPSPSQSGGLDLGRGIWLVPGCGVAAPASFATIEAGSLRLPDWAGQIARTLACDAEFRSLIAHLQKIDAPAALPLDQFALRAIVLHAWRRLILKSAPAAELALGASAASAECRALVHSALDRLPRPGPGVLLGKKGPLES